MAAVLLPILIEDFVDIFEALEGLGLDPEDVVVDASRIVDLTSGQVAAITAEHKRQISG